MIEEWKENGNKIIQSSTKGGETHNTTAILLTDTDRKRIENDFESYFKTKQRRDPVDLSILSVRLEQQQHRH